MEIAQGKERRPSFCEDYRILNQRMKADRWPLPKIEEIFSELSGRKIFTALSLFAGYSQKRKREELKERTNSVFGYGTLKLELMPFGLINLPSTFKRMMEKVLCDLNYALVYLDFAVIAFKSTVEHVKHPREVFEHIFTAELMLKIKKCTLKCLR